MIKKNSKDDWKGLFSERLSVVHKKNINKIVAKLLKKISTVRYGIISRSKKANVECKLTDEELKYLFLEAYGTACKYSGRILDIKNMVVDHKVPISKGGTSNIDNLQIISRFSNNMKGSLSEEQFLLLLKWIKQLPEELQKDISIRLAGGKR